MSFDGSFTCAAALRRFLARSSALQSHSKLIALSQKGEALTAEDLVATIADPFLHPSYTIPVMGCFRPLCRRIVERVIEKLRVVPSLESESMESSEEIGDDDARVIDFYLQRGRGLRIHELASLAFCRALDLAPFLLGYILSYFRFSPPPFKRHLSIVPAQFLEKDVNHILCATRVCYRFLLMEPKTFSELWDWSCFLDLIELTANLVLLDETPIVNDILDIRWCGIQILSVVLRMSDRVTKSFAFAPDKSFLCFLRWEEFCQDTSIEKVGWYIQSTEGENGSCPDRTVNFFHCLESFDSGSSIVSSSNTNEIASERRNCRDAMSTRFPFILTSTLKISFEMVMMSVSQKWPVLLYGPAGTGKTALINYLAHISGNRVLFIHMDEQMDSKTLIGTYVCTEQPGEFRWQPGSLTQAVLNGLWVVFEDIDKAPSEVQSIILPLLEGSSSFATGHGEAINVAESFRLFATVSTLKHGNWHSAEGRFSFSALWRKVLVGTPSSEDLLFIINAWYPCLQTYSMKLIETFERVNTLFSSQLLGAQFGGVVSMGVFTRFSLRDLLKFCKRVSGLCSNHSGHGLTAEDHQNIYHEAVDVFAASLSSFDNRLLVMKEFSGIWKVSEPAAENRYPFPRPIIKNQRSNLHVGRVILQCTQTADLRCHRPFVGFRNALHVLEEVASSVKYNEPVLLVGETGTGKTTFVQNLATRLGQPLTIMNLSQQTDVSDLLGGFKPTDALPICKPLYHEFKALFRKSFSMKDNDAIFRQCDTFADQKNWKKLLRTFYYYWKYICVGEQTEIRERESGSGSKRKRLLSKELYNEWESFSLRLGNARKQIAATSGMLFKFVEGAFITALKSGHWILLDEVNLAPPETLHRISGALDGENGTICLSERGDMNCIERHPNFRLFACMNPATDAGKRDLPYSFRSRFTEYFVDDIMDDNDLTLFVNHYMDGTNINGEMSSKIVKFYKDAKKASEESLQDGANQKPHFSLRSLARALEYTKKARKDFGFHKALYDGFCMFFLTLLDSPSAKIMKDMVSKAFIVPPNLSFSHYLEKLKLLDSQISDVHMNNYVLTDSVKENLKNLARAVYIKRYPVLLQGPTSSGKTSLVQYLASITGNEFVRINNHEHTDLQEYFGSYITDSDGRLQFQDGVLVKAVRKGHWIVLDELNLAPSDVLEALNRLLDDNRELFVPELQEAVQAHPNFMLFATQNPPTIYGGRKMLSRAFRNRFLEIHVDEIPVKELTMILERRCKIPASYAEKMIDVMKDLQLHRQNSRVFAGKHGFITPRDLFRWADRFRAFGKSYEDLAKDGYFLLAERLRDESEKKVVQETLERHLRVKLRIDYLYKEDSGQGDADIIFSRHPTLHNIIWTKSMQRLYFLVNRCFELREPVLLVGETGGGKTSVCQLLSAYLNKELHILNCHQYTETSDFLGGSRPVRDRSKLSMEFRYCIENLKLPEKIQSSGNTVLSSDISNAATTLQRLSEIESIFKDMNLHPGVTQQDLDTLKQDKLKLMQLYQQWQTIFIWQDGPLVQAMKKGHFFLVDEISLADDSVLERLNSVLEPERKLLLAEKGGSVVDKITGHQNFFILATMNPGGDYGKKELSPALRNRFTEIWVPSVCNIEELRSIAKESLKPQLLCFADYMLKFWQWFHQLQTSRVLTVRDLLSWISFVNENEGRLDPAYAYIHGAFLILLDGLSLGTGVSKSDAKNLRERSLSFLVEELKVENNGLFESSLSKMETYGWGDATKSPHILYNHDINSMPFFGIDPFYIAKGQNECKQDGFKFLAPTTNKNALRVLRAMQLSKPVLLEGSPGVGKTSLVAALAKYSGHSVVRINLSEQTDMMDLLGSDLPFDVEDGIEFCWSDGILLQAMKNGSWVLLDELNLAPQSVLEGLNSILDHRAEVSIPELGQTFKCPDSFRIFACQNPSSQGGGRKGLPRSFLNRFTKVYVDELNAEDYLSICESCHPSIHRELLLMLISFNRRLFEDTMIFHKYGQEGSPWEFNLRDILRSCQIIEGAPANAKFDCFLSTVYLQRMRTAADRKEVLKLYESVFGVKTSISLYPQQHIDPQYLIVGSAYHRRNYFQPIEVLKSQINMLPGIFHSLEAALHCVQHQWLCILVGPYSSGKTSLIRLLAQLTGNKLHELNLSSGTDVSELLGCFEQYNSYRNFKMAVSQVENYVNEYFSLRLELGCKDLVNEKKGLFSKWFAFLATKNYSPSMATTAFAESSRNGFLRSLEPLIEIIEELERDLKNFPLPVSWSLKDLKKTLKTILDLKKSMIIQPSAKFQWVTSDLIKAIENGEWVVLDNANLCNPTVLDRINSLVEPEGTITINECGLIDGKPRTLHAHPKFRMFLTVDPKHGQVSRAMRNRGVEIYMMQPNWLPDVERSCLRKDSNAFLSVDTEQNSDDSEINDVERLLILSGIPVGKLVVAMGDAHMYAKTAGLHLGVRITLLELVRWVQLFQLLLMNGNQPVWSLQLSWEHTYMSSLGEVEGRDTINQAKLLYLSECGLYEVDPLSGCSLSLPGGWPLPHTLKNFALYSREASVKRNFLYLEFLGSKYASYELKAKNNGTFPLNKSMKVPSSIIPKTFLHQILLPDSPELENSMYNGIIEFDKELADQMLFIASSWSVEQATTEDDLLLYIEWYKWFSSLMNPYCYFFESFLMILEQERGHPIWKYILEQRKESVSHYRIDDLGPLPMLSRRYVDMVNPEGLLRKPQDQLVNAIDCLRLLHLTYQQWNAERNAEKDNVYNLLGTLRCLEKEVLKAIVESQELMEIYSNLIEHHMSFWKSIVSMRFDYMSITWNCLKKEAMKLYTAFPKEVEELVEHCVFLEVKPSLWLHGGHPLLPPSSYIHEKLQQLLALCDAIWPTTKLIKKTSTDRGDVQNAILSANTELRYLAMQGVCMSSYIATTEGRDNTDIVQQLEDMHQRLSRRFKDDRENLKLKIGYRTNTPSIRCSTTNCVFSPGILCRQSGIDSWLATRPLFDKNSFSMDIKLLQELSSSILVDEAEVEQVLYNASDFLQHALDYSINFSSRSPLDFSPHQTILWILNAWSSLDSACSKASSFVCQMWLKWHSSLWGICSGIIKKFSQGGSDEPYYLVPLTRIATLDKIIHSNFSIEDFDVQCLKLRVASQNLLQDSPTGFVNDLRSAAHSLFKQIIFVHKKSFEENVFEEVKSLLCQLMGRGVEPKQLQELRSHILTSSHNVLASLVDLITAVVEALDEQQNLKSPFYVAHQNLGRAWLYIGVLRFDLLFNQGSPDPVLKYAFKHSQRDGKISLLKLEIKVRQYCDNLAGGISNRDIDKYRASKLQKLEMEQKRIKKKVVFRPEPPKYDNLMYDCAEFWKLVPACMKLVNKLHCKKDILGIIDEACNWQATSASFINRLSEGYAEYLDIIQPIQVAVYEMKLGLSLALSSALEREYLKKVEEGDIKRILATINNFMQFSRNLVAEPKPFFLSHIEPEHITSESIHVFDGNLLERIITISSDISIDEAVYLTIDHNNLIHVAHNICCTRVMDKASFMTLDETFVRFATLWLDMKEKVKDDGESQFYKFRPRSIKLDHIFEGNLHSLNGSDSDGSLPSEYEENLLEQEFTVTDQHDKTLGDVGGDIISESISKSVIHVHDQLFVSSDPVKQSGISHISDEDRMLAFMNAYKLGAKILNGDLLFLLSFSTLDDTLVAEHLLHLSLEYGKRCALTKQVPTRNIYKESNASEMFKMVEPLILVQERVRSFLDEWPDHPGLQKLLDLINMLLAIQPSTPLSKALLGLQILVSKAQSLQENTSWFSIEDQLDPIYDLLSTWQKWGVDCWPSLLDEVQEQYKISAGELWFPLHGVLHSTSDDDMQNINTIGSLEEFILLSNVGEFQTRLHLLFAFHGQINRGICLTAYSSHMGEKLKILYNMLGYYVQFLPSVLEYIKIGRQRIEKDLEECQKLFKWDHHHNYSSIENFRRTRQKMWKLVQKFNDILHQPFMDILNQEASLKREKVPAWLDHNSSNEMNAEGWKFPLDLEQLSVTERLFWYDDWRNKVSAALEILSQSEGYTIFIGQSQPSELSCQNFKAELSCQNFKASWEKSWMSLEKICRNAADFAHLWKHGTKNLKKRRALGELLKILETCGLSKHRSELDLESDQPSILFRQTAYDVAHLVQPDSSSFVDVELSEEYRYGLKWATANQYYFKNLAIMKQVLDIRSNFNKVLTLEQVNRATSFLHHLVGIQQDQRYVLYGALEELKKLRQLLNRTGICNNDSVTPYQHDVLECMWQQKRLFDSLLAMSKDVWFYLRSIKKNHLSTCDIAKSEADKMLVIMEKFHPIFKKSKEALDKYVLGCNGSLTTPTACMPLVVSEQMEQSVESNLKVIEEFEKDIDILSSTKPFMVSVKESLFGRFRELVVKGKKIMEDFRSKGVASTRSIDEDDFFHLEAEKLLIDVFRKLDKIRKGHAIVGDLLPENITLWTDLFKTFMGDLHLDSICNALSKTIVAAGKFVNRAPNRKNELEMRLKQLHVLLDHLLTFGESILYEFLDVHMTMAEMTHALAQIFALLFSKGFGDTEPTDDIANNEQKDATGTGMGEGEGINDVSDQIDDESQLFGTSEKQEGPDASDKVPSDKEKGIEMDEEFEGEALNISEDAEDDDNKDDEDVDIESKMGKNSDDTQVVDQKLWDKEEDGNPDTVSDKYESGPSAKEKDTSSRELRGKDDNALKAEETTDMGEDETGSLNEEDKNSDIAIDDEDMSDMKFDKDNAYGDPTDIPLDEKEPNAEDASMDETQVPDTIEEMDSDPAGSDEAMANNDETSNHTDHVDDENQMQVEEITDNKGGEDDDNSNMDYETNERSFELNKIESSEYPAHDQDSSQPTSYPNKMEDSGMKPTLHWSNSDDINNGLAPSRSHPSDEVPVTELSMPDTRNDSMLTSDQPKPQSDTAEASSSQRTQTNPYRSVGDALKEWKERVQVSVDPQEQQSQAPDTLEDENANEYRYVTEKERSTSQALGPAAADQSEKNLEGKSKEDEDQEHIMKKDDVERINIDKDDSEICRLKDKNASIPRHDVKEMLDAVIDDDTAVEVFEHDLDSYSTGLVSFKSSYMNEVLPPSTPVSNNELSKFMDVEDNSVDVKQNSTSDWRRYELATTRLSQELAEQMRLVLEPTLASRLQGDYRTGKRINMKKVIPYIASHFRKDKIWLRRTKPNKRDYQVVVAVDDSRSMSECHCGSFAIEALVTVCRAMSQLEVGQFAVASFGEKRNIKLLHDFGHTFTGEAGAKIISHLSFKQDNTIADEPVVDLLKYLNTMLDAAVVKARTPSGINPLNQLILIIGDGRFHQKENLKRRVRDALNKKRMIAFILLDSPQESIIEHKEICYDGGNVIVKKYLDSFPFPYYIVLKNIEALPRTLADLLRQWFELMQSTCE